MAAKKGVPNSEGTRFPTGEKQVETARKGGIASGKARRGKKLVQYLLGLQEIDKDIIAEMKARGIPVGEITNEAVMTIQQIKEAKTGDTAAYNAVLKAAGYSEENINVKGVAPIVAKDAKDAEEIQAFLDSVNSRKNTNKE